MNTESAASKAYKKKFIIALAIFWGTIFTTNGIFVYYANTTWTGLTTQNAYEKGLAYNSVIAQNKQSKLLGWQGDISFKNTTLNSTNILFSLKNKKNIAITGAIVTAKIIRPTREGFDKIFLLTENKTGDYFSKIDLPLAGLWDIEIIAQYANKKSFFKKRLDTSS